MNGAFANELSRLLEELESKLQHDVLAMIGPIIPGVDGKIRDALERMPDRNTTLSVILNTGGGVVEIAERIVNVLRHFYGDVRFIIADVALSAGTVLAMSGDSIMMDYYACLGPIDPQIEKEGKLIPALSYVVQFQRLMAKATAGTMTTADFALLQKFDLAELHQFEEARALSRDLLVKWLANYKFKDWKVTESSKTPVTQKMREKRAEEIAGKLSDNERWHSHGRGIPMKDIQTELNLRIDDFGKDVELSSRIRSYFQLALEYMRSYSIPQLVHARGYL